MKVHTWRWEAVHSLIVNLNQISKPHISPNFSCILYFQNRMLSRCSLTKETALLSLLCWGIDTCKSVEKEDAGVPFNHTMFSEQFLAIFSEEHNSQLSSAPEVSLLELEVPREARPLFCICEDKFGVSQHVELWVFPTFLLKLLPLISHSAETSIWHFLPYETFVFEDSDRKEKAKLSVTKRSVQLEGG